MKPTQRLPTRSQDYSGWYQKLLQEADLLDYGPVKGCLIFKPYGFALWEHIRNHLDTAIKATGHQNAYFPLFIPQSYLSQEAQHVAGFAKECAIVTHHRLTHKPGTTELYPDPAARLEEPLIIRPTSETLIWSSYRKWIQSWRDLPLLLNQWCNVVRWEMRPRPLLRTVEILWQEGHTAHATQQEAVEEAEKMLQVYYTLLTDTLALSPVLGKKSENEKFAGAETTYTLETLTQDGKALQAATSHFLGQNFARAFDVRYTDQQGNQQYVWGSSWGVTTRLLGALVMTHADDNGLVLPPKIAPWQAVILPIYRGTHERTPALEYAQSVEEQLQKSGVRTRLDTDDTRTPGWKFAHYELKGVPLRLAVGKRERENQQVEITRRDTGQKITTPLAELSTTVTTLLQNIQQSLLERAEAQRLEGTHYIEDYTAFQEFFKKDKGFVMAYWDGTAATEKAIQADTQATLRCIPLGQPSLPGRCIYSGKPAQHRVLFAHAY